MYVPLISFPPKGAASSWVSFCFVFVICFYPPVVLSCAGLAGGRSLVKCNGFLNCFHVSVLGFVLPCSTVTSHSQSLIQASNPILSSWCLRGGQNKVCGFLFHHVTHNVSFSPLWLQSMFYLWLSVVWLSFSKCGFGGVFLLNFLRASWIWCAVWDMFQSLLQLLILLLSFISCIPITHVALLILPQRS